MVFDTIIVGTGPAGLTAGIYAARYGLKTLLLERESIGGELVNRDLIYSYPGFPDGVAGTELRTKIAEELEKYNPEVTLTEVESIEVGDPNTVTTSESQYAGRTVVLAGGARHRKLNVHGEEDYNGRGVFYCAKCDGPLYKDKTVAVAGGNNKAVVDALFLTKFASDVLVFDEHAQLSADEYFREKARTNETIKIHTATEIRKIAGDGDLIESISVVDTRDNSERVVPVDGLYVSTGLVPNTEYLEGVVPLDNDGYVVVNQGMETEIPGILAAGDIRQHSPHEVAAAVGDGVTATESIKRYLTEQR